jgi:hypothetical protein
MAGLLTMRAAPIALLHAGPAPLDIVAGELRRWALEPFDRRRANCALSVLAYVERATGRRRLWWPRLVGVAGAGLVWDRPDRLERVARWALGQLGCVPTSEPRRGDVGLVEMGAGQTAAICTDGRGDRAMWAGRAEQGVVIAPGAAAVAWGVSCRPQ